MVCFERKRQRLTLERIKSTADGPFRLSFKIQITQ